MRVLALNPYHGGSHRAFLEGWSEHSRHTFTALTLPPRYWKWRMRHAPIAFARQIEQLAVKGGCWDVLFCTDMLNLAECAGLLPSAVSALPRVAYFHENQLTYPLEEPESERDAHLVITNLTTALAADEVWFNSAFHRDDFLAALPKFLRKMPDHRPLEVVEQIRKKSAVHPPGIDAFGARGPREPGPLRILWAARWEADKNPDDFFTAVERLDEASHDFRLSVLGQSAQTTLSCFERARKRFADRIDAWGYLESDSAYRAALSRADVVVSTALHEFFGLSVVEAVAAGALPLVPDRLAYPEVFRGRAEFLYDGTTSALTARLKELATEIERSGALCRESVGAAGRIVERFRWERCADGLDRSLESLC